jgi:hypothetical protein
MKNKFISLLFQEPNFSLKLVVIILLATFSFFLHKGIGLKRAEIAKFRQDKAMVEELSKQIPVLEEKLKALELKVKSIVPLKRNVSLVLKGILTQNGASAALINDDIYQKNDLVGGLIITAITSNAVTLEDPSTSEQTKIQLPE